MKIIALLKRNGVFFTLIFLLWLGVMYALYASHSYFPQPLPSQMQWMQAQQAH